MVNALKTKKELLLELENARKSLSEVEQLKRALRLSDERFSVFFTYNPIEISITRLRDNVIIDVNDAYIRHSGFAREEIIGRKASEMNIWVNPEERERIFKILKEKGRISGEELRFRGKSGEAHPVIVSAEHINYENEDCLLMMTTDISRRKHAEEDLKESEEFNSSLLTNTPNAIFVTYPDGTIKYVNPAFEKLTGFSSAEIIGKKRPYPWWPEDKKDEIDANLEETTPGEGINLGDKHTKQMTFKKKSGGLFIVELSAAIINNNGQREYILVSWVDITERIKVEQALNESEENFRRILEDSPFGILILDSDDNAIYGNRELLEIFGYDSIEEYRSIPIQTRYSPESYAEYLIRKDKRNRGEEVVVPVGISIIRKDGEIRYLETMRKEVLWSGKRQYQIIFRDITEQKKAEQALKDSEEKFSKAFSTSANAIGITSLKTNYFIEANDSFSRFTGYSHEEIIGRNASDLNLWLKPEELKQWQSKLKAEGRVSNMEFSSRMKTGEIRIGLASAEVINISDEPCRIIVITDITERKKAEDALKMSEENFRHSLDDSPLGIRIVNSSGGPEYVNQSLLEIYGYNSLKEFLSRPIEKRFTPEMYQEHLKIRQQMVDNNFLSQRHGETRIVRKDGEIRILEVITKEILWNGEKQYQLLYIDITERKQAEEQLKKAMVNLEQSSARLAAANKELEAFSYSVSHDLRSPLRSIDGFSQALMEDYAGQLDVTGKDYLQRLRNASQKMGELIDGLLRLSRLSRSELRRETMDIGVMAVEIMTRLRETQPERKAEFIIGKDMTANVDPQLCRALLENLLGNAWKFTGKAPQAVIEFGATQSDGQKTFFVKDNGAGFDMTYVDKLFGAFQRLHDNTDFPGTGIGLATVRRIVNRHGGNVSAEGAVGKGATFYFTFG